MQLVATTLELVATSEIAVRVSESAATAWLGAKPVGGRAAG